MHRQMFDLLYVSGLKIIFLSLIHRGLCSWCQGFRMIFLSLNLRRLRLKSVAEKRVKTKVKVKRQVNSLSKASAEK